MGFIFSGLKKMVKLIRNRGQLGEMVKRSLTVIILLILLAVIIISDLIKENTVGEGSYDEGNMANVPYAASTYMADVTIEKDGTIKTGMSAQELWDELIRNDSYIEDYLDGPQELLKLMNAELVTCYPDTRSEDEIDEPLDEDFWRDLNRDVDNTEVQGIIKFKRAQEDGTTTTMTYVDSETFYGWMEKYSSDGDETARQNALTHFTIEENPAATTQTDLNYNGVDVLTDISERIVAAANESVTPWPGEGLCQAWVRAVYRNAGLGDVGYATAADAYRANVVSTSMDNIPIGAAVYGSGTGYAGHVGIYIGNGMVVDSVSSGIKTQTIEEWVQWQVNSGNYIDGKNGWLGWGWQAGQPTQILSEGSTNTDDDNDDNDNDDSSSSTPSLSEMELITDNGKVTFYNADGSAMEGSGVTALGYDVSEGQVAMKDLDTYGNCVIYIQTSDTGEGSYANGKFFYVTDTGGGLADNQVDVYVNEDASRILSEPYGSYGSGAKIYLVEEDVTLEEYQTKYLNKESEQASGSVGSDIGKYNVVVATWNRTEETLTSDDPNVEQIPTTVDQAMTVQKIDYTSLVSNYTLPFNYLWAFLVAGRDKDVALEMADLVYESEIEITVHDNVTTVTDIDTYTYEKDTKVHTYNVNTTIEYGNTTEGPYSQAVVPGGGGADAGEDELDPINYTTTHTVVTTTNTINVSLTKADVWIVTYEQEFTYSDSGEPDPTVSDPVAMEPSEFNEGYSSEYGDSPDDTNNSDPANLASSYANGVLNSSTYSSYTHKRIVSTTCTTDYYYKYSNMQVVNSNSVHTRNYTSSPGEITEEKTDAKSDEPNVVTILMDHNDALDNIVSAPDWLYEMLESSEKTSDMVDLTSYILYCATGLEDTFLTEFDFDGMFKPGSLLTVGANDYVVDTTQSSSDIVITDLNKLKQAFSWYSNDRVLQQYAYYFLECQEKYHVNAVFAAAVSITESSAGTNIAIGGNNMFSISNGGQGNWNSYGTMEDSIDAFFSLISTEYFTNNQYSVDSIARGNPVGSHMYCVPPDNWIENTVSYMTSMFNAAGINVSPSSGGTTATGEAIVAAAREKLGCSYVWGAEGPNTFDCSGLAMWCYNQAGISIPRTTEDQKSGAMRIVPVSEARVGDILYKSGHVGIYIGNGQYIHAPQTGDVVKISDNVGRFECALQFY